MMWFFAYLFLFVEPLCRPIIKNSNDIFILLFLVFLSFIFLIILIGSVAQVFFVTHRRLHDLNLSGWWQLITFIPFGQLMMIGFIFFKGTDGPNKYGDPPE